MPWLRNRLKDLQTSLLLSPHQALRHIGGVDFGNLGQTQKIAIPK